MTDQQLLKEMYIMLCRIEGYIKGSTEGLVSRLNSIDSTIEFILTKRKKDARKTRGSGDNYGESGPNA